MKKAFITILFLGILVLSGCQKEEWTKPVRVSFAFSMDESTPVSLKSQELLEFYKGEMNISQISFEGYREIGENVFFDSDFAAPVYADLMTAVSDPPVAFDIPQGIYNHINLTLALDSALQNFSLSLEGTYHSLNPNTGDVTVIFTCSNPEIIDITPQSASGEDDITFLQDQPNEIRISLNTKYLFQLIYSSVLESAKITYIDEQKYILISSQENEKIYALVVNRIEKATEALAY